MKKNMIQFQPGLSITEVLNRYRRSVKLDRTTLSS